MKRVFPKDFTDNIKEYGYFSALFSLIAFFRYWHHIFGLFNFTKVNITDPIGCDASAYLTDPSQGGYVLVKGHWLTLHFVRFLENIYFTYTGLFISGTFAFLIGLSFFFLMKKFHDTTLIAFLTPFSMFITWGVATVGVYGQLLAVVMFCFSLGFLVRDRPYISLFFALLSPLCHFWSGVLFFTIYFIYTIGRTEYPYKFKLLSVALPLLGVFIFDVNIPVMVTWVLEKQMSFDFFFVAVNLLSKYNVFMLPLFVLGAFKIRDYWNREFENLFFVWVVLLLMVLAVMSGFWFFRIVGLMPFIFLAYSGAEWLFENNRDIFWVLFFIIFAYGAYISF